MKTKAGPKGSLIVDATFDNYTEILDCIKAFQTQSSQMQQASYIELLDLVCDRMICDKMVRSHTPPSNVKRHDIPSPSKMASDQLLLPNMNINGDIAKRNSASSPEP